MQEFAGGLAGIIRSRSLRLLRGTALNPRTRDLMQIKAQARALYNLSR
jgi:hypothetical protein